MKRLSSEERKKNGPFFTPDMHIPLFYQLRQLQHSLVEFSKMLKVMFAMNPDA